MQHDDQAVLVDMRCAAELAIEFLSSADFVEFQRDFKTQSAVLHQLLVLGEACKRLSIAVQQRHAEIPWNQIAGMRDILIHQYHNVDLHEVWKTVKTDLPPLVEFLQRHAPRNPRN